MLHLKEDGTGVIIKVRVQPRASRNQLAGIMDDALRVRITAPPVDGEANEACIKFLAEVFKVPRQSVQLVSGHTGRNKMIRIAGINAERILQMI
ncbi:DUF167 domain-containing protein [Desulfocucumis palustris]|uniref:DUF167 domain-containing protein n=1 Tax=Desulfocucumis palustris TaxID=1898651 RepID=UPI000CEA00EE|nr:DUF167 domain-containing protein [Desulfocucumis palustris]